MVSSANVPSRQTAEKMARRQAAPRTLAMLASYLLLASSVGGHGGVWPFWSGCAGPGPGAAGGTPGHSGTPPGPYSGAP